MINIWILCSFKSCYKSFELCKTFFWKSLESRFIYFVIKYSINLFKDLYLMYYYYYYDDDGPSVNQQKKELVI